MFCALNGATRRPRRAATRHSAAASTDLPACEAVPWNITTRALGPLPGALILTPPK